MSDDQRSYFGRHFAARAEQPDGFAAACIVQARGGAAEHLCEHGNHSAVAVIEAAGGGALLISTCAASRFVNSAHAADACPMSGSRFDGTLLSNSHEQDASSEMISQAISAMRDTVSFAAFGF
jgi:hypothetical protein